MCLLPCNGNVPVGLEDPLDRTWGERPIVREPSRICCAWRLARGSLETQRPILSPLIRTVVATSRPGLWRTADTRAITEVRPCIGGPRDIRRRAHNGTGHYCILGTSRPRAGRHWHLPLYMYTTGLSRLAPADFAFAHDFKPAPPLNLTLKPHIQGSRPRSLAIAR